MRLKSTSVKSSSNSMLFSPFYLVLGKIDDGQLHYALIQDTLILDYFKSKAFVFLCREEE